MTQRALQITAYAPLDPLGRPDKATPAYPKLALGKYRRRPSTPANDREYGEAVLAAIRALQLRELAAFCRRNAFPETAPCASRSWAQTGDEVLREVNRQNKASLSRALEADHAARTDYQVRIAFQKTLAGEPCPLVRNISQPKRH